ncbi:hypothetical protein AAMO2058_001630700 [Amorphochlora amoebiformis]|mmetsp:Transcript_12411/g.19696  ORF Transcript_12411/g.19696 Transcript_12411/m.19696 type:complete len:103 (-) Transcript_12411:210-518(-)
MSSPAPEDEASDFIRASRAQNRLQNFIFMEQQKEVLIAAVRRVTDKCFKICYNPNTRRTAESDQCMDWCSNRYFEASWHVIMHCGKKIGDINPNLKIDIEEK